MKSVFLLIGLIFFSICIKADKYDQQYFGNATIVRLEKPGSLAKAIGKNTESITSLQIIGELSDKDMQTLSKLTNLKGLNIRYTNIIEKTDKAIQTLSKLTNLPESYIRNTNIIEKTKKFPALPNLEVLFLPDNQSLPAEYLNQVPANKNLKVMMLSSFAYYSLTTGDMIHFAPFASLQKVILSSSIEDFLPIDNDSYGISIGQPIIVDTLIYENSKSESEMFKARFYEGINGYMFYVGTDDVDFCQVQAVKKPVENLSDEDLQYQKEKTKPSIPQNLDLQKMNYIGKGFFNDSDVENIVFSSSKLTIEKGAFENAKNLKSIKFANSLGSIVIPSNAFANCPSLEKVIFDCPVIIERNAFSECNNIQQVVFNAPSTIKTIAFYNEDRFRTSIKEINTTNRFQLKASIKEIIINAPVLIEENAFPIIESITFNVLPKSLNPNFAACKTINIPQQEGSYDKFITWGFSKEHLCDPLANLTCDIVVTEPGDILKFLPIDKLDKIKSLTITGYLYDTDITIIKQCTHLQYLNLANTYIAESPSTQEHRQTESEIWNALAELSIADAQLKRETGEYNTHEAKQQVTEAVFAAAMMQSENPEMTDCFIPARAFENMLRLEEVTLPTMVKRINRSAFKDCFALQKIDLGNALEEIGREAFSNTRLTNIKFPETLKSIHVESFENVKTLFELDFSSCTMETTYGMIYDYYVNHKIGSMENVHTLYMPKGMKELNFIIDENNNIKNFYVGKHVKTINQKVKNMNLYFQTEMAPDIDLFGEVTNCNIFIPKNANITSYYATFNCNGNKIIQEQ